MVPTNTEIFLCGLKLCGERRTEKVLFVSKKKIGGNHAFFRDNKASIWGGGGGVTPYIALCFTAFQNNCCLIISIKCAVTPNFLCELPLPLSYVIYLPEGLTETFNMQL